MQANPPRNRGTTHALPDETPLPVDAASRRLRERYIAARFLQFPQPAHALRDTANVLRWSRQLLDDDQPRQAAELLHTALEEDPAQRPLWLFLIDLAFTGNDTGVFVELSESFRRHFPGADAIPVIDSLGRKLLPNDPRYAHADAADTSPGWSMPDAELRDALRQQKLHTALVDAMAFHLSR